MTEPSTRTTRADVARRAGVSPTAVTMVLSGNYPNASISEPTRQRIFTAARELKYKPNIQARGLKARRSLLIAFLCRQVYRQSHYIMVGMQEAMDPTDYSILHYSRGDSLEAERRHLELCWDRNVDGIVLTPARMPDGQTNQRKIMDLIARGVPIVQLPHNTLPEVPSVTIDLQVAMRLALEHLITLGHRRIAVLYPADERDADDPIAWPEPTELLRHYQHHMAEAALEPIILRHQRDLGSWSNVDALIDQEVDLARMVLEHPSRPTAIIALHDYVAAVITRALTQVNRPAPESLSIVGMHNSRVGRLSLPQLTTIEMHHEHIGCAAASLILRQIERQSAESQKVKPELVIRRSTAPPTER